VGKGAGIFSKKVLDNLVFRLYTISTLTGFIFLWAGNRLGSAGEQGLRAKSGVYRAYLPDLSEENDRCARKSRWPAPSASSATTIP